MEVMRVKEGSLEKNVRDLTDQEGVLSGIALVCT